MPFPLIIVHSWKGNAKEVGEEILNSIHYIFKYINFNIKIYINRYSNKLFVALAEFSPLDYIYNEENNKITWGLPRISMIKMVFRDTGDTIVSTPQTPYYSANIYLWKDKDYVVLSPWWLPPVLIAYSRKPSINRTYVWSVVAWGYPIEFNELHPRVIRLPLGSKTVITPVSLNIHRENNYDINIHISAAEAAKLLLDGASAFLEQLVSQKIKSVYVGLSGGLDSRTVLASLVRRADRYNVRVNAYTIMDVTKDPREVEIAREVAESLGVRHEVYKLDVKDFSINKYLKFLIKFPDIEDEKVIANGTGGDKTLAPLSRLRWREPDNLISAAESLVKRYDYTAAVPPARENFQKIKKELINKLLSSTKAKRPLGLIREYLAEYRLSNWLSSFNRPYVSPFLYPRFFIKTFMLDPIYKKYYIFYSKVIYHIEPTLLKVPYYNIGCRLSKTELIQKIKYIPCITIKLLEKVRKGQRGSTIPSIIAWNRLEKAFRDLKKKLLININIIYDSVLDEYQYRSLLGVIQWAVESKPLDARALTVASQALSVAARIALLEKARYTY